MLCQVCQQNPATIFLEKNINGHKTRSHLCASCYQKDQEAHAPFSLLSHVFGQNPQGALLKSLLQTPQAQPSFPRVQPGLTCPQCRTSWEEVRQTGLFGCSLCYDTFADVLPDLARNLQGSTAHIGSGLQKGPEPASPDVQEEEDDLTRLKKRLAQAVQEEAYEEAALLRDHIKALEKEGEDHA